MAKLSKFVPHTEFTAWFYANVSYHQKGLDKWEQIMLLLWQITDCFPRDGIQ